MTTITPYYQPSGAVMELNARCIAAAAVLGDYKAEVASADSHPPRRAGSGCSASPRSWRACSTRSTTHAPKTRATTWTAWEPYCAGCGAWVGIFRGHGDGWHHFRGSGTAASPVELFDAGHAPEVAWCRPPGRSISRRGLSSLARPSPTPRCTAATGSASGAPTAPTRPREACDDHLDDLDRADSYG